jgi:hypothetical protein
MWRLFLFPAPSQAEVERDAGTRRILTGPGFYLVTLFLLVNALIAFSRFVRHTGTLHGTLREQALYVLTGAGVTAFFGTRFTRAKFI